MRTVSGSSAVTLQPPSGTGRWVRHHAPASSSPVNMPRSSIASRTAYLARPHIRSVRSSFSAACLGASGLNFVLRQSPGPSASHSIWGNNLHKTWTGPMKAAYLLTTLSAAG